MGKVMDVLFQKNIVAMLIALIHVHVILPQKGLKKPYVLLMHMNMAQILLLHVLAISMDLILLRMIIVSTHNSLGISSRERIL